MKKFSLFLLIAIFITASSFIAIIPWKTDDNGFNVKWAVSDKKGEFNKLEAAINFDKSDLANSNISASIDINSLHVDNEGLQNHLLSPDFFNAAKFPKSTFKSTEIKSTENGFIAKGMMTMKDSTKAVELPFTFTENGNNKAVFSGTMNIFAGDFGVMKKSKEGNDKVTIYLTVPVSK